MDLSNTLRQARPAHPDLGSCTQDGRLRTRRLMLGGRLLHRRDGPVEWSEQPLIDLALHGVAFHQAHQIVGDIVRAGLETQRPPEKWTLEQLREFSPAFGEDGMLWLRGAEGVRRREILGGTGPGMVRQAIQEARARLENWRRS